MFYINKKLVFNTSRHHRHRNHGQTHRPNQLATAKKLLQPARLRSADGPGRGGGSVNIVEPDGKRGDVQSGPENGKGQHQQGQQIAMVVDEGNQNGTQRFGWQIARTDNTEQPLALPNIEHEGRNRPELKVR